MRIEHLFEGLACVHCGTTSANAPMCRINGKPIAVGEHGVTRDRPMRRSSVYGPDADYEALLARRRELFPNDPAAPTPTTALVPKTCDLCGAAYVDGGWEHCSGACCD